MNALLATIAALSVDRRQETGSVGRQEPEPAILDAIYSPLTAAALLLVAHAKMHGPISDATADLIRDELRNLTGTQDVTELLVLSGWLTEFEGCPERIAGKFELLWRRMFDDRQRATLVAALGNIASSCNGSAIPVPQAVGRLSRRMC